MSYQQSEYIHDDPSMDVDSLPSLDGSSPHPPQRRVARALPGPAARVIDNRNDGKCALLRPYILPACLVTALLIILSFARFTESQGPHVDHFGVQPFYERAAPHAPQRQQHQRKSVNSMQVVSCVDGSECATVHVVAHKLVTTRHASDNLMPFQVSALADADLASVSTTELHEENQCFMDFAFYSKQRLDTHGSAGFYNNGQPHLLAVTTRENGRGRAVVMQKVLRDDNDVSDVVPASNRCMWSTLHFFQTPEDADFKDFTAVALSPVNALENHRQRVAISSSASSAVWIGELDIQRWTWSLGQIYDLPVNTQCQTASCTLASLQWLSNDMLACISSTVDAQNSPRKTRSVQILVIS